MLNLSKLFRKSSIILVKEIGSILNMANRLDALEVMIYTVFVDDILVK